MAWWQGDKYDKNYNACTRTVCNWEGASAACDNLIYNGHNDWRLPTLNELTSRVTLNSLLYPLINLKLLSPKNTRVIKDKKINITTAAIETTNKCNFRCPHCYVDKADYKILSYNEIIDLIDEL